MYLTAVEGAGLSLGETQLKRKESPESGHVGLDGIIEDVPVGVKEAEDESPSPTPLF